MEIVYNIVIPILTSLIGGIVGGLFTFLGVKMTLSQERNIRKEDLKIREEEQKEKEIEKNIELNKKINQFKPKLTKTSNSDSIKYIVEVCLLPYTTPKLFDEELIIFGYSDEIYDEDYWDKYEIVLQNTGKREIISSFLQVPYKCGVNIYLKSELMGWKYNYLINYYSDECGLPSYIHPNDKIKLVVHFPKNSARLRDLAFDLYINDEDGNYWFQIRVNSDETEFDPEVLAPDAFSMHFKSDYYYWFIYDAFYYSKNVEKCFKGDISKTLEKRKPPLWERKRKQDEFVGEVNRGLKRLKFKLPLD